jgi:hypothetical protein
MLAASSVSGYTASLGVRAGKKDQAEGNAGLEVKKKTGIPLLPWNVVGIGNQPARNIGNAILSLA